MCREGLSLQTDPCWPKFHAFPSTLDIVRKLTISPEHEMHSKSVNVIYDSLSLKELEQLEKNQKNIQEKRLERWDEITTQKHILVAGLLLLIPVSGIAAFVIFRKKRK